MFSSLSQRIFGTTPRKNSSPGPTRPPYDKSIDRSLPSTAPPGIQETVNALGQFPDVSDTWGQADPAEDDEDIHDGLPSQYDLNGDGGDDDTDDYVDPFAEMVAFSTQVNKDDEEMASYGSDREASANTKSEASNVTDNKESRRKRRKINKSDDQASSDQASPSSTTNGRPNKSAAEEANDTESRSGDQVNVKSDARPSSMRNKKKRRRESTSSQSVSAASHPSSRSKKTKVRKPLEDIEDDDMERQPEEMVPDSPSNQLTEERPSQDADLDHDPTLDFAEKPKPQQSQPVNVSRQLFQPIKGTSTTALLVSHDAEQENIGDGDHEISLSSPSVNAQRRRSMSRGSQISSLKQNLSRESTGLPDRISEAAELGDEGQREVEDAELGPEVDVDGDVSMADVTALVSGALVDEPDHDSFADQLPPSSQPPREDSHSVDGEAIEIDDAGKDTDARGKDKESGKERDDNAEASDESVEVEEGSEDGEKLDQPRLPTRTSQRTRKGTAAAKPSETAQVSVVSTPEAASRRRGLDSNLANMSELSHFASPAQKSIRSTGSGRQRSKPNFFDNKEVQDQVDKENEEEEDEEDAEDEEDEDENDEQDRAMAPRSATKNYSPAPSSLRRSMRSNTTLTTSKSSAPNSRAYQPTPRSTPKSSGPSRAASASKATTPIKRIARRPTLTKPTPNGSKSGKFDSEDKRMLDQLVANFKEYKGWSQEKMNGMIQLRHRQRQPDHGEDFDRESFKELWDYICSGFPGRTRAKIMAISRRRFYNFKKRAGGWTQEEDERVLELLEKHGDSSFKWVCIGEEMDRHPNDVHDRYRNYIICGQNAVGVSTYRIWTEEEEEQLVECVLTALRRMEAADSRIRPKKPMDYVNWQVVSDLMQRQRSRLQCYKKWKQLNIELSHDEFDFLEDSDVSWFLRKARLQLREMPAEDKYKLVKSILDQAPGKDEAIHWQKLVDVAYRKKWHRQTLKLLWFRLKQRVPGWETKPVRDCARWLLEDAAEKHKRASKSKVLDGGNEDGQDKAEEKAIRLCKRKPVKRADRDTPPKEKTPRSTDMVDENDTSGDGDDKTSDDDESDNDDQDSEESVDEETGQKVDDEETEEATDNEDSEEPVDEEIGQKVDNGSKKVVDNEDSEEPVDKEIGQGVNEKEAEEAIDWETPQNDMNNARSTTDLGGAQRLSVMDKSEQTAPQLSSAPSLQPAASQGANTQRRSPAKKRIRLSKGKTVNDRVSEGDFDADGETPDGTPSQSQLDVGKIPDRKTEKRLASRQRISSGSRARSTASVQSDFVENNDKIAKDMPPIRVPPSTQTPRFRAINTRPSHGNFARRTGSSILPGEPVELTEEVMAALEAASNADGDDFTGSIMGTPVSNARKRKRRHRDDEIAESP